MFNIVSEYNFKQKLLFVSLFPDFFFVFLPLILNVSPVAKWALMISIFVCNVISKIIDAEILEGHNEKTANQKEKYAIWFSCLGKNINSLIKTRNEWIAILIAINIRKKIQTSLIIIICSVVFCGSIIKQSKGLEKVKASPLKLTHPKLNMIVSMMKTTISIFKSILPFLGLSAAGAILLPDFLMPASSNFLIPYAIIVAVTQFIESFIHIKNNILTSISILTRAIRMYAVAMLAMSQLKIIKLYVSASIAIFISLTSVIKNVVNAEKAINVMFSHASTFPTTQEIDKDKNHLTKTP